MQLLRNLSRRKLRTGLTIAGITIGIWALVVFSAMATKIGALVDGGSTYYADKILVSDGAASTFGGAPMRLAVRDQIAALPGVEAAAPAAVVLAEPLAAGVTMGSPDQVVGTPVGADEGHDTFSTDLAQGRSLGAADEGSFVAVIGSAIAAKRDARLGDTITVHGHAFTVVGILQPTLTAPDSTIAVPFAAAQQLLHEDLPPVIRDGTSPADLASQFVVYPAAGTDMEVLATRIEATVDGASAMTGQEFDETVGSSVGVFNTIVIGIGLIALIVGGLSIVNTMAMSVAERTREIGIRRAIGAGRRRIVRELVTEAGLIGLVGGLLGLALGGVVVAVANEAGRASGTVLFEMTLSNAVSAVLFSVVLGMLAGVVPAWGAARLDPVVALRHE
jgi:putative ABC transport system permease protein